MTKRILNCPCVVLRIGQRVAAGVEVVGQVSPRYPPRLIARPFNVRVAGTIIKFIDAGYLLGRTQEARWRISASVIFGSKEQRILCSSTLIICLGTVIF